MNTPRPLRALLALVLTVPTVASAALTFTVTTTAEDNALGYISGQTATFVFVLNAFAPATPAGETAAGDYYLWQDEFLATDPALWSDVHGTGLTGTWTRPTSTNAAPYSVISAYQADSRLSLFAGTDAGNDTGLTVNGFALSNLSVEATYTGLSFAPVSNVLPDPTAFFTPRQGTYSPTSADQWAYLYTDTDQVAFKILSLSISPTSAIPEPSTYAALLAAVTLLAAARTRRQRQPA